MIKNNIVIILLQYYFTYEQGDMYHNNKNLIQLYKLNSFVYNESIKIIYSYCKFFIIMIN